MTVTNDASVNGVKLLKVIITGFFNVFFSIMLKLSIQWIEVPDSVVHSLWWNL